MTDLVLLLRPCRSRTCPEDMKKILRAAAELRANMDAAE